MITNKDSSPFEKGWISQPYIKAKDGVVTWCELPYNSKLKTRAAALRKAGILSEVLLWNQIKQRKLLHLDFYRQKIIGNYIVDFYCHKLGLVIEIDGCSHEGKETYDERRNNYLASFGLIVLHIADSDVRKHMDMVLHYLNQEIGKLIK